MVAARDKTVVVKELLELLGLESVLAGEFNALVADLSDILERLGDADSRLDERFGLAVSYAADILVDGVELHGDLRFCAAAEAAASGKRGGGARKRGAAEEISA